MAACSKGGETKMRAERVVQVAVALAIPAAVAVAGDAAGVRKSAGAGPDPALFAASDRCIACHTGMRSESGLDVSIGSDWRASMMANSARDPYWQAAVRRETMDHPAAAAVIEDECSACHMPMSRYEDSLAGRQGPVFQHLRPGAAVLAPRARKLALDGVSCSVCHQIGEDGLGTRGSFNAGFVVASPDASGARPAFGPYDVDEGRKTIMRSASGRSPARGDHVQGSELCATCHTLITHALGPDGATTGELPEQVPYLEWKHSDYSPAETCQTCHMPVVAEAAPMAAVWAEPREGVSRHVFRGGNFFMPLLLDRYRADLGVAAASHEFDRVHERAVDHLQTSSASVTIESVRMEGGRLEAEVSVTNHAGHKLPTAYPSRRTWIQFVLSDPGGSVVFVSGALRPDGSIEGNEGDSDGESYEPHREVIERPDQVQVYEAVMADSGGRITTGLLSAVAFVKDNRLLPSGFDKRTASDEIAVRGDALADGDFDQGGDRVRYSVDLGGRVGPLSVRAELWYQPIGFRWARNLAPYRAAETDRFVAQYESLADRSAVRLAVARAELD
jgi:hypothetical protein